jgi:hypothetical protein
MVYLIMENKAIVYHNKILLDHCMRIMHHMSKMAQATLVSIVVHCCNLTIYIQVNIMCKNTLTSLKLWIFIYFYGNF